MKWPKLGSHEGRMRCGLELQTRYVSAVFSIIAVAFSSLFSKPWSVSLRSRSLRPESSLGVIGLLPMFAACMLIWQQTNSETASDKIWKSLFIGIEPAW